MARLRSDSDDLRAIKAGNDELFLLFLKSTRGENSSQDNERFSTLLKETAVRVNDVIRTRYENLLTDLDRINAKMDLWNESLATRRRSDGER